MRCIAFIVLTSAILAASPALAAEERDDICAVLDQLPADLKELYEIRPRWEACRSAYWGEFKARPASELMDAESFKAYEEALEKGDCDTPLALLANAFVAAYPRAPNILDYDSRRRWEGHYIAWESFVVSEHYLEIVLCRSVRDVLEAQAEIERHGIAVGRYRFEGFDPSFEDYSVPPAIRQRNGAIFSMIHSHGLSDYGATNLALAKFSHEGKALRFVPEYQYFLLQKALLKGIDRDELADLLTAVETKLLPSQMEDLKRQARRGEYSGPRPILE